LAFGFAGYCKYGDNIQGTSGVATIGRGRFDLFPLHISLPVVAGAISNCYNPLTSNDQTLQPFPHTPNPPHPLQEYFLQFVALALLQYEETGRF
jgi:hypothetical protein